MEKVKTARNIHENMEIGILLALAGGFLDAYTYLTCGGVFANAQTGNIVLLGIHAAKAEWAEVIYYFIPVVAFFLGVLITELLRKKWGERFHIEQYVVLAIEILVLGMIAILPGWIPVMIVNVAVSFLCSLQVNSFRAVEGLPYASTMCTGNLRYTAEHFFSFLSERDKEAGKKSLRYVWILLSFCAGAGFGTYLISMWGRKSGFICCGLFFLVLLRMVIGHRKQQN